jgi:hypothetical protein
MGQTFPTSVPSYPDTAGDEFLGSAGGGFGLSRILDDYGLDISAIATKLGTGSSTPSAGTVLRSTGPGVSSWGAVDLSTDVGDFDSATLKELLTDETGSGAAVFANSPTLITPTIASFEEANHDHEDDAGGGQLDTDAFVNGAASSEKLSATIGVSLERGAAQTIEVGTEQLAFDTVVYDYGSDVSGSTVVAPITGLYRISACSQLANLNALGDSYLVHIYVGGAAVATARDYATAAGDDPIVHVCRTVLVTAGQAIETRVQNASSATESTTATGVSNYMTVDYVGAV